MATSQPTADFLDQPEAPQTFGDRVAAWLDRYASNVFVLPAVIIVLVMSIFPLIVSLYLSMTRVKIAAGGFDISFIGLANFNKLIFGREQRHTIGKIGEPTAFGWFLFGLIVVLLALGMMRLIRKRTDLSLSAGLGAVVGLIGVGLIVGFVLYNIYTVEGEPPEMGLLGMLAWGSFCTFVILRILLLFAVDYLPAAARGLGPILGRLVAVTIALYFAWITVHTFTTLPNAEGNPTGIPGTILVTLYFVILGVALQYLIGLGLALLLTGDLFGKRFFRIVFLLPMMITPVGVAYMFRMVTNTSIGPLTPIFRNVFGVGGDYSWAAQASSARVGVMLADVWQWTPFIFIVLVAALEGMAQDQREAALVDGATSWQFFRYITLPQILPVSTTVILIRLIEAFKIIDLPFVMTRGGPGTATEPMTLHAYQAFKATDFGGSAAVAYVLLFLATYVALNFINNTRPLAEEIAAQ
ncbi:MAG: sugar ABC transporter permease [Chloroflexota bacterium]